MKFQLEQAKDVFAEIQPLLEEHWKEISHYQDIPLAPDYERYFKLQEIGMLRVYTARDEENALVGYAVFFINFHLHYSSCKQALQDILFIRKDMRGHGGLFILWCDRQLAAEGVQVVSQHIKAAHNFGSMLERIGYELVDLIYSKRLDKPRGG